MAEQPSSEKPFPANNTALKTKPELFLDPGWPLIWWLNPPDEDCLLEFKFILMYSSHVFLCLFFFWFMLMYIQYIFIYILVCWKNIRPGPRVESDIILCPLLFSSFLFTGRAVVLPSFGAVCTWNGESWLLRQFVLVHMQRTARTRSSGELILYTAPLNISASVFLGSFTERGS